MYIDHTLPRSHQARRVSLRILARNKSRSEGIIQGRPPPGHHSMNRRNRRNRPAHKRARDSPQCRVGHCLRTGLQLVGSVVSFADRILPNHPGQGALDKQPIEFPAAD